MARVLGPEVLDCPLTPRVRSGRVSTVPRLLLWKRPTGWAVAYGLPVHAAPLWTFELIAQGLPCWHLAAHVAAGARWDQGDGGIHMPRWVVPALPVSHACWDVACSVCGRQEADGCWSEFDGAWTCAGCWDRLAHPNGPHE